jgi:hypothetical protein
MTVEINLQVYKQQLSLQQATFIRINHTDSIIAEVYKVVTFDHLSGKPRSSGRGQERVSDVVAFLNYKGVCCCSIY